MSRQSCSKDVPQIICKILYIPIASILIGIAIVFSLLILKLFIDLILHAVSDSFNVHYILEQAFQILLLIEVTASIKIYFTHNHHFPLRYLFYIGITDLIRYLIVNRSDPNKVLMITIGLLILTAALTLLEIKNNYIRKRFKLDGENYLEL